MEQLMIQEFESEKHADIEVHVNDRVFKVNKFPLRVQSPVFKAMFENDTVERKSNRIEIKEADSEVVKKFLLYFYIGKVEKMSDHAMEMFHLADYYGVKDLRDLSLQSMLSGITSHNVIPFYRLSHEFSLDLLMDNCLNFMMVQTNALTMFQFWELSQEFSVPLLEQNIITFIKENTAQVVNSQDWLKFDKEFRLQVLEEHMKEAMEGQMEFPEESENEEEFNAHPEDRRPQTPPFALPPPYYFGNTHGPTYPLIPMTRFWPQPRSYPYPQPRPQVVYPYSQITHPYHYYQNAQIRPQEGPRLVHPQGHPQFGNPQERPGEGPRLGHPQEGPQEGPQGHHQEVPRLGHPQEQPQFPPW